MTERATLRSDEIRPQSSLDCEAGCDFFCLRFSVWYPSRDCALRTRDKTYAGCLACDQGRFNLKRHAAALPSLSPRRSRVLDSL